MRRQTGTYRIMQTLPLNRIRIKDEFWSAYIGLVKEVVVPYQWEVLNDKVPGAEPSYAVRNFRIAAGEERGDFGGMVFQDSDAAKWLEAAGYLLQSSRDCELEGRADYLIDLIAKAQHTDGYLNTYFTLKEPGNRWTNLAECHELYCAGHMIEAAVAYYEATGKRKILDVVCKLADHIDSVFGVEDGKIHGYDGHQEIELALVKLYRVTGNARYLKLCRFFLDQRGKLPHFYLEEYEKRGGRTHFTELDMVHRFSYSQSHLPIREQQAAEGHAVRAVYMLTAMADVAAETGDEQLLEACRRLWRNIVGRRMYITGGIGSMAKEESFSLDYDLPNDTAYAETCASIGLIFFAQRMLLIEPDSEYADVMERALYNTVVGGMSRDGRSFFYVNPLEVVPDACEKNHIYNHVKPQRQGWFPCACCPPNIARLLASLGHYIYTQKDTTIYAHLYIGGEASWTIGDRDITLEQISRYTLDGSVSFRVKGAETAEFTLALRIPSWSGGTTVLLNGESLDVNELPNEKGYLKVTRRWMPEDMLEIAFAMPIRRMKGHPLLRHTAGKVAIQCGPFVYCAEEADNGPHLHQLSIGRDSEWRAVRDESFFGGIRTIVGEAYRIGGDPGSDLWNDDLYKDESEVTNRKEKVELKLIPYFAWANRGVGEMRVWIHEE